MEESHSLASPFVAYPKNESSGFTTEARVSPDRRRSQQLHMVSDDPDDEDMCASPTRLETALSIGGAGPRRSPASKSHDPTPFPASTAFRTPSCLLPQHHVPSPSQQLMEVLSDSEDDMIEVPVASVPSPQLSVTMSPDAPATPAPVTTSMPPSVRTPPQGLPCPITSIPEDPGT